MNTQHDIEKEVAVTRRKILALIQGLFGTTPQWEFCRSQLLTLLGERGLQGSVEAILKGTGQHDDNTERQR